MGRGLEGYSGWGFGYCCGLVQPYGLLACVEALESWPTPPAAAVPNTVLEESPTNSSCVTDPMGVAPSSAKPGPVDAHLAAAIIPPRDATTDAAPALPASAAPARSIDAATVAANIPPATSH